MTSETDLRSLTIQALGVLTRGRTYFNLLYLALSLPLAILYVAILILCAAAGTVLSIVGIGVIILLGGLAAASGFATLERELAVALLGVELPPPPPLPAGSPWHRLRAHLSRAETWKSLAYLTLKLPFGLFTYTLGGLLLVPAMGLTDSIAPSIRRWCDCAESSATSASASKPSGVSAIASDSKPPSNRSRLSPTHISLQRNPATRSRPRAIVSSVADVSDIVLAQERPTVAP